MPSQANIIANFFVKKAKEEQVPLTLMKLIKLVYIAHGWHLAHKKSPLISEPVEAWPYGPVVPSVYYAFKQYGKKQIEQGVPNLPEDKFEAVIPHDTLEILGGVWEAYKKFDAFELSSLTHQKESPWDIKMKEADMNGYNPYASNIISNDLIGKYYLQKLNKAREKVADNNG